MWHVEVVEGTLYGTSYLIKSDRDQGYLSNNSPAGGGVLHFMNRADAEVIADVLNRADVK